jgi:SAM-dependent methyltransferase
MQGRYLWVEGILTLRPGFGSFHHADMMRQLIVEHKLSRPTNYIGGDFVTDDFHGLAPYIDVTKESGEHPNEKEIAYLIQLEMEKGEDRESTYRSQVAEMECDSATVEDTEPEHNFGFMKDPHAELYPCAWEGERMKPEASKKLKAHVLNEIELEFQQPDQFIYFTVYGSGASYNWDEEGDFDIQMWVNMTKFNELHEDQHDLSQDDLLVALRRIVQQVNFPSFADLGLATDDCEGKMLIQYYPKPGTGAKSENLAQKPYACYDMETDDWIVRPKPLTPEFYGEHFLMVIPKAEDIAIQAEAAVDELERNIVNWQFWYGMWSRYKNHKYKEQFETARDKAEQQRDAVKVLFKGVFGGRQEAYGEGGQGIEDERDITQKVLEVWGIFQKLKHYARITLPWEEQLLPADDASDEESDEEGGQETTEENDEKDFHELIISRWSRDVNSGSEDFQQFFEDASRGLYAPQGTLDLSFDQPHLQQFYDTYKGHAGNFDQHIETSIPGYREVQVRKGAAIARAFPGASVMDIGGSEGSWGKAISQLGGQRTVNVEPNNAMAEHFNNNPVPNAELVPHAFGEGFAEYPKFEPQERYDIINESMTFQFISPDRPNQLAEAKRLLKPGGLFITDEKVITKDWHANEQAKDEWKKQFYTQDQLAEKQQVVNYQDEESAVGMVSNMVPQEQLEGLLRQNFRFVQNYWSSGNFQGYLASDSQETINRFLAAYNGPRQTKFAKWDDVMEHAQRARATGQIQIQNKMRDPDSGQLHVIGQVPSESNPGEFHETEFWQDDPDSEAITLWSCDCPWGQKSWGRTRQFKRYEGRPCAHLLALYWDSLGQPFSDEAEQQPQQQTIPGLGEGPQQWIGPTTPGGPNMPTQNPLPESPPAVEQTTPPQPAFSQPKQPNNTNQLEFPGTFSRWKKSDYNGWTNWDTWHTALLIDNYPPIHEAVTQGINSGWTVEQFRDWVLEHVVGPHNVEQINQAKEWNTLTPDERREMYPDALIEHDEDDTPDMLMNDGDINWQEIYTYLHRELEHERKYMDDTPSDLTLPESWSRVAAFTNGDTVRNTVPVEGQDRDGNTHQIPRNSAGEVIWSDETDTIVIYPLRENGRLEPHLVRAQGPTEVFYASPSFNPGPRRRR